MTITTDQIAAVRRCLLAPPRDRRPPDAIDFKVRPISEDWRLVDEMPAFKSAVCNVAYIWRDSTPRDRFGSMPEAFAQRRFELRGGGLLLPAKSPLWATEDYRVWQDADAAALAMGDPTAVSAWHVMAQIPDTVSPDLWCWMTTGFLERELTARGAAVAWAVHGLAGEGGSWLISPHFHAVVTARRWKTGPRKGERHPAWIASTEQQLRLGAAWRRRCATTRLVEQSGLRSTLPFLP